MRCDTPWAALWPPPQPAPYSSALICRTVAAMSMAGPPPAPWAFWRGPWGKERSCLCMFGGVVEIWWLVDCSIEMPHARAHLPQPLVALGEQLPAAEGEVLLDYVLEHGRRPVSCVRRPWVVA